MRYKKTFIILAVLMFSALFVLWQLTIAKPPRKPGNPGLPGCLAEVATLQDQVDELTDLVEQLQSQALVPQTGQTIIYTNYDDGYYTSGAEWPIPRFTDNGDGTITDDLTKLTWMENANCDGRKTWTQAITFCFDLASGSCGLTDGSSQGDWRLPTINEMVSLIHWGVYNPAVPDTIGTGQWSSEKPFINVEAAGGTPHYWTSTTYIYPSAGEAFCVPLSSGGIDELAKTTGLHVWCVKGGS